VVPTGSAAGGWHRLVTIPFGQNERLPDAQGGWHRLAEETGWVAPIGGSLATTISTRFTAIPDSFQSPARADDQDENRLHSWGPSTTEGSQGLRPRQLAITHSIAFQLLGPEVTTTPLTGRGKDAKIGEF
jgi:hypothetical protein